MKALRHFAGYGLMFLGLLWGGLILTGCQSSNPPVFANVPGLPETGTAAQSATATSGVPGLDRHLTDVFQIGDQVTIIFSPQDLIQPFQETIKEDGTITPPYIGPITAVGKSPGDLQKELQTKYNLIYKNLTVTVQSKERYFYVSGEVKQEGAYLYLGKTDILQAIAAAHGFTDFANKKKVQLTRAGSKKSVVVNCVEAQEDPKYDVQIYPGDRIWVPRSLF